MQSGKVIFITGAAGNLGRAVAAAFDAEGASLALIDLHRDRLISAFQRESERRAFIPTDLGSDAGAESAVRTVVERFGRIDVVCNLAGGFRFGPPVHESDMQAWDLMFDMNVKTVLHTVRAAVPFMLATGGGKIVNVGAISAQKGLAGMGPYIASKSAVMRLTETMSAELRAKNINVNCVLPGTMDTPENRASDPQAAHSTWLSPADLASVVLFLASDSARAVHGAAVPVIGHAA